MEHKTFEDANNSHNEEDLLIGHWFKGESYRFNEEGRYYCENNDKLNEVKKKCSPSVSKYFQQKVCKESERKLRLGRRHYTPLKKESDDNSNFVKNIDGDIIFPNKKEISSDNLSARLSKYNGYIFEMSTLICTQFTDKEKWEDIFDEMIAKQNGCTIIGHKMASSLVKTASTRIFANPEQSIMELPVNSVDAYKPKLKVGKFGMGFFSFLYWLIGHPRRQFNIYSYYKEQDESMWCYTLRIREINGVLSFTFEIIPINFDIKTGSFMELVTNGDNFNKEQHHSFQMYLDRLKYITGVSIYVKTTYDDVLKIDETIGVNHLTISSKSRYNVYCYVSNSKIFVEDYATGINLQVLLGSLFVPSISTKTIQVSEASNYEWYNKTEIEKSANNYSSLIITVSEIVICEFNIPDSMPVIHRIDLPPNTRLPVSRDDIILNEQNIKIFDDNINKLFSITDKPYVLQSLLKKYIDYTPSEINRNVINNILSEYYEINKKILVPKKFVGLYKSLDNKFLPSNTYDILSIEKYLDGILKYETDIWKGIKVVTFTVKLYIQTLTALEELNYTSAKLYSYIFITQDYRDKNPNFATDMAVCYPKLNLQPVKIPGDSGDIALHLESFKNISKGYEYIIKGIEILEKDEESKHYLQIMRSKIKSLEKFFIVNDNDVNNSLRALFRLYVIFGKQFFVKYYLVFMKRLDKVKYQYSYGSERIKLNFDVEDRMFTSNYLETLKNFETFFGEEANKVSEYTKEIILTTCGVYNTTLLFFDKQYIPFRFYNILTSKDERKINFFRDLVKISNNIKEYLLMARYIDLRPLDIFLQNDKNWNTILLYMHRLTKITYYDVKTLYFTNGRNIYHGYKSSGLSVDGYIKFIIDTDLFITTLQKRGNIKEVNIDYNKKTNFPTFFLSNFIRYLYRQNVTEQTFSQDLKQISGEEKTSMQIIEIAVNEGTTKSFLGSVMTELVQNSFDVIREFNPKNKSIDINTYKTDKSIILSIDDYVGMSFNAFLSISIPFLSTKLPSETVTGEMGSGFFNVYRESEKVIITTYKNGLKRVWIDEPIKNGKRIIDIKKTYMENIPEFPTIIDRENGTNITIIIPFSDMNEYFDKLTEIEFAVHNHLNFINHENITYNGEHIYTPRKLVLEMGNFELYVTQSQTPQSGYLLTKGMPFQPLENYMKTIFSNASVYYSHFGIIMNIKHGGYVPTQTRTKINIPPSEYQYFIKMLYYIVFLNLLFIEKTKIRQTDSIGPVQQLYPLSLPVQETNACNYLQEEQLYENLRIYGKSINERIILGIKIMGDKSYSKVKNNLEKMLTQSFDDGILPILKQRIIDLIQNWFQNKNKDISPKKTETKRISAKKSSKKAKTKKTPVEPEKIKHPVFKKEHPLLLPFVTKWITTYINLAKKLNIKGYNGRKLPNIKVGYYDNCENINGFYEMQENTLNVNVGFIDDNTINQFINVFKLGGDIFTVKSSLKNNKLWSQYFDNVFPSTVLCHEIEHYRRNSSHESGFHSTSNEILFMGDNNGQKTFDECAVMVYNKLIENGLFNEFLKETI